MEKIFQQNLESGNETPNDENKISLIQIPQMEVMEEPLSVIEATILSYEKEKHLFYNLPKYYDMAFDRDFDSDIEFFERCFREYSEVEVHRILEAACGTGMFMENLPRYGYQAVGYDLSDAMVEYSKLRLQKVGLNTKQADAVLGNMKNKLFDEKFDAALVCINSLGYLTKENDIISHFEVMARNVKKGGLYIVEISCMCNDLANEKRADERWLIEKEGIKLELSWNPCSYDVPNRIRHVEFQMLINDHGNMMEVKEDHELRLWLYDEFKQFLSHGGFEIMAIYNQKYENIPLDAPITGELGVLFYVLKETK